MRTKRNAILLGVAVLVAGVAQAQQAVNNYSWLQLPPRLVNIGTFIGGGVGGGSGYGSPADYRWADHVWIPNGTLTGNGATAYWAALNLGGAREIENVWVQWWAQEGTSVTQFYVDASNDGTNWTNLGSHNYGSPQANAARFRTNVDVPDGEWQYVRVRLQPGDYAYASAGRGGPGLYCIEPMGDGTLTPDAVNWANSPNFVTSVSNNGFGFNGLRYNDGLVYDDEGVRTGNNPGNWDAGDYAQINLGTARQINEVLVFWDWDWSGTAYDIQYSTDGTNFLTVGGKSAPSFYYNAGVNSALGYRFNDVTAQWFRLVNATGPEGYHLLNQVLLFVPEPASALLLGLAGLVLLRRR